MTKLLLVRRRRPGPPFYASMTQAEFYLNLAKLSDETGDNIGAFVVVDGGGSWLRKFWDTFEGLFGTACAHRTLSILLMAELAECGDIP